MQPGRRAVGLNSEFQKLRVALRPPDGTRKVARALECPWLVLATPEAQKK